MHALFSGGLSCQIAPEALFKAHSGPASLSLPALTRCCTLQMSTFVLNKKELLFRLKEIAHQSVAFEHMKRNFHPLPSLYD